MEAVGMVALSKGWRNVGVYLPCYWKGQWERAVMACASLVGSRHLMGLALAMP